MTLDLTPLSINLIRSTATLGMEFLHQEPDTPFVCWQMPALGLKQNVWGVQRRIEFSNLLRQIAKSS
jgi:hypothetical protein